MLLGGALAPGLGRAQPITLTQTAIGFNNPISVDYYAPSNQVILSTNYPSGSPYNFELVATDGTRTQFTNISGLTDEVYIAAARQTAAGFTAGDFFTGTGVPGEIARVTGNGTVAQIPWVTLPGETGLLRGALHIDETGVFGGDLLVATDSGAMWRVSSAGNPTFLGSVGVPLEGLIAVPNDPSRYGPFAGKAVSCNESGAGFFAFDPNGAPVQQLSLGIPECENLNIVPANQFFYGVDFASKVLWSADPSQFVSMVGDIVVGEEFPGNLWRVRWNAGTGSFDKQLLATVGQLEGAAFAPTSLPVVNKPPTITCPGASSATCSGPQGATQTLTVQLSDPDNDALQVTWNVDGTDVVVNSDAPGTASDSFTFTYAVGTHTVTVTANDGRGGTASCTTTVTIGDTFSLAGSLAVTTLWPPNHDLVNVGYSIASGDVCAPGASISVAVYSNEPDVGDDGDKNFSPDAKGLASGTLRLRSERPGNSSGRVYLIVASGSDQFGNTATDCRAVVVPHDQSDASIAAINATAASAVATCQSGQIPAGYVAVGVGPVRGPKQ
jgi:hypothetical protein